MADLKQTSNGADYTTYQLNPYLKNRLKYHAASRLASQTGEGLSQAMSVDGHTVTTAKVWAAPATAFPNNADKDNVDAIDATNDLVTVFKTPVQLSDDSMSVVESNDFWATDKSGNQNGKVWTNTAYPAVKLYENVPMTAVKGSDGGGKFQAFEILAAKDGYSEGTLRVSDWVAPTSVADQTTGKVVAGFSGIPMANGNPLTSNAGKWGAALGTWEFVYIAGMLTFEPGYTPQEIDPNNIDTNTRKSLVSLTAFKYCGEYLSDTLGNLATSETIETINNDIDTLSGDIDVLQAEVDTITLVTAPINTVSAEKTVTYNGGKTIVGTAVEAAISGAATGDVTVTLEGKDFELLSFYQRHADGQMEIIYPEIAKTAGADDTTIYTLTADYGEPVSGITSSLVWEINCKVK